MNTTLCGYTYPLNAVINLDMIFYALDVDPNITTVTYNTVARIFPDNIVVPNTKSTMYNQVTIQWQKITVMVFHNGTITLINCMDSETAATIVQYIIKCASKKDIATFIDIPKLSLMRKAKKERTQEDWLRSQFVKFSSDLHVLLAHYSPKDIGLDVKTCDVTLLAPIYNILCFYRGFFTNIKRGLSLVPKVQSHMILPVSFDTIVPYNETNLRLNVCDKSMRLTFEIDLYKLDEQLTLAGIAHIFTPSEWHGIRIRKTYDGLEVIVHIQRNTVRVRKCKTSTVGETCLSEISALVEGMKNQIAIVTRPKVNLPSYVIDGEILYINKMILEVFVDTVKTKSLLSQLH